jgi:hypothetical protein
LPEFYDDDYGKPIAQTGYEDVPEGLFEGAAYIPETTGYESVPEIVSSAYAGPVSQLDLPDIPQNMAGFRQTAPVPIPDVAGLAKGFYGAGSAFPTTTGTPTSPQPAEKGFLESISGPDKLRLGLGLAGGVQTAMTARKARQGSQQGADQIRQLGRPYQERGLAEQSAASRGELNPVGQQQLDAMRARAAQAGVNRGGVGVAQQQRAEEDLRQRLLAAQQDFGLKLSGIGDQYTMKAIQEGIRADQEISNMYANYFGNLAKLAAPTVIQSTQSAGK